MALDTLPAAAESWLRIAETPPADARTDAIFAATQAKLGYIRGQQRALAHRPDILAAVDALGNAVVRPPSGELSPRERELMALVVSAENRCEACVFAHEAALRGMGGDAEWAAAVAVNYRRAHLSVRERALADFAIKVTRAPAEIEPSDHQELRAAGVPDIGILEATAVACYFNFTNRLNSSLGIRANREAYQAHR
ncbi:MAG TPA: peroxidase-related enzyme [Acetobacteraceae bacterium]|jgi:uncharacterized peroxidase-related enzyme|nr:peroxidase-related enzyme [Acetobacteraceae bacterium]